MMTPKEMKNEVTMRSSKISVMVFPCGSENAREINAALRDCVNITLYGASSQDDHGRFIYRNYIGGLPYISESNFITQMNNIIEDYQIDVLIPTHDTVAEILAANRERISAQIMASCAETCRICRDKLQTYQLFKEEAFCPKVYSCVDGIETFPIFLKPRDGQGGKGTKVCNCKDEIIQQLDTCASLLLCEYLPGAEYTVDCFTDRHGILRFVGPRTRARIWAGISVRSETIKPSEKFTAVAEVINRKLSLRGLWYFQVKEDIDGKLKLLEVSTRTAGTMCLHRQNGVNFPLLSVYDCMGYEVDICTNSLNIMVDRSLTERYTVEYEYDVIYIDYDDTIIDDTGAKPMVLAFLYQAVWQGKKIVLLTRHEGDLLRSMNKNRIAPELFDEIHLLDENERKSDYVTNSRAVFIDNRFAERKQVAKQGIPVYDVDAIECLMEWRQ